MRSKKLFVAMVAIACAGMVACGSNHDNGSSISDSTAPSVNEIDSVRNESYDTGRAPGTANDSVKK